MTHGNHFTSQRFANVDFAVLGALQRYSGLRLFFSGYDINCQYMKNYRSRLDWVRDNVLDDLSTIATTDLPETRSPVPNFHLYGHGPQCRPFFSANFIDGCAMTDFEGQERIWSVLNALGNRTREMTSGHRHDVINDHHSDQNVRRVHGMRACFCWEWVVKSV